MPLKVENKKTTVYIICLLTASILWLINKLSNDYNIAVEVPVHITNVPEDTKIVARTDSMFYIQAYNRGFDLIRTQLFGIKEPLTIPFQSLSLKKSYLNKQSFYLNPILFDNAIIDKYNFKHISFEHTDSLFVYTERLIAKKVAIYIPINIDFAKDVELTQPITIAPDSITIFGSHSLINSIDSIAGETQYFSNLDHSVHKSVAIHLPKEIQSTTDSIQLSIVTDRYTEASFIIPILSPWDSTHNVRIFPPKVKVHCSVPLSIYKDISLKDFVLHSYIDSNNRGQLLLHMHQQPPTVQILNIEPQTAEYIYIN